jgi:hypothetical protein
MCCAGLSKGNNLTFQQLRNFANASRQLGSSAGILSSAFHLRERLAHILFLFRENAADLFPAKVQRQPRESSLVQPNMKHFRRHSLRHKHKNPPPHILRPTVDDSLDPEDFPKQLEQLALDVSTFLNCLNEFPEFTDEAVNASIRAFEGDLKVTNQKPSGPSDVFDGAVFSIGRRVWRNIRVTAFNCCRPGPLKLISF